jgi:hypothetical protein
MGSQLYGSGREIQSNRIECKSENGGRKMKYEKPELTKVDAALRAIQNSQAKPGTLIYDSVTQKEHDMGTVNAYEADE